MNEPVLKTDSVIDATEHWLDALVIGLNLCPFARGPRLKNQIHIVVAEQSDTAQCLQAFSEEAAKLERGDDQATTLFVLPEGYENFDDYLDLLALSEALLEDLGFSGTLQIASFHPDYQFEGTSPSDVSNWTNRAPFPILHLLQEASVSKAVDAHSDPESIPENNIRALEQLGLSGVLKLLERA